MEANLNAQALPSEVQRRLQERPQDQQHEQPEGKAPDRGPQQNELSGFRRIHCAIVAGVAAVVGAVAVLLQLAWMLGLAYGAYWITQQFLS